MPLPFFIGSKMSTITRFISDGCTGIGTSYDVSKKSSINVSYSSSKHFLATIKSIQIKLSNLSGSPSTVSVLISSDTTGDGIIIPDETATISQGLTTTNSGQAVISIDVPLHANTEDWSIFYKLDSGTADIVDTIIVIEV